MDARRGRQRGIRSVLLQFHRLPVSEAVEGAATLAAPEWAALLADVSACLPSDFPRDRSSREDFLDSLDADDERLEQLSDRFYDLDEDPKSTLDRYFRDYIAAHPDEFFTAG